MTLFVKLLGVPFLACLAMIAILAYVGIYILKREIIFVDIALAQIVTIGAIVAHCAFGIHSDSLAGYCFPLGAVCIAAAFYAAVRRRIFQIPLESVIGISYAIAAAAALFLLGTAPGGHVHVQHMLAGSILWITWSDVLICIIVFSVMGLFFYLLRTPFRRICEDYEKSLRAGIKVIWWDFLFYVLVGIIITVSVRLGGVVVVFAFLVIPATISALFSSNWRTRLIVAWAAGFVASLVGLIFAHHLDFSVGPSVAAFLGLELVLASLFSVGMKHSG